MDARTKRYNLDLATAHLMFMCGNAFDMNPLLRCCQTHPAQSCPDRASARVLKQSFCSDDSAFRSIASRSFSYDFIHVGAGCSPENADFFAEFLSSEDGAMIAPVASAAGANLCSHLCHKPREVTAEAQSNLRVAKARQMVRVKNKFAPIAAKAAANVAAAEARSGYDE